MLKTPLKVRGYLKASGDYRVMETDGNILAPCLAEEKALEIVQACNAYDDLLAACKAALEYLSDQAADLDISEPHESISAEMALLLVQLEKVERAIAKAEETTNDRAS